jgi:Kdo2-lipid IVA lauroyltransferase/acyltransferase
MAQNKSPLKINLEYYSVAGIFGLLKALPIIWSETLALLLLRLLLTFIPKRRRLIHDNLALCFPEKSPSERQAIADGSIWNLARGIARYPRIPDFFSQKNTDWIVLEGDQHMRTALQQGKGVICFTAHTGFWELGGIYTSYAFSPFSIIGRSMDNPRLDKLINGIRSAGTGKVISHRRALKECLTALRNKETIGILIDQNFYKGGMFVDFFGRPAATTTIISLLARRTESPVIPVHNVWRGNELHIIFEPPITLSSNPNGEVAVGEDTQRMSRYVEKWVRQDPHQWLWLHNRWKRRPEPGDVVYPPVNL